MRAKVDKLDTLVGFEKIQWAHIKLTLLQLQGLLDGQNSVCAADDRLSMLELLFVNADGEIMELANSLEDTRQYRFKQRAPRFKEHERPFMQKTRLSMNKLKGDDPEL